MTLRIVHRIVRIVLIAIPVLVMCWLIAQHFAFSGVLNITNDFSRPSPFIKGLWPPGRVEPVMYDTMTNDYIQRMLIDPVTFRVQLPRAFDAMTLSLRYAKEDAQPFRVGIRTVPEQWSWELHNLTTMRDADGWNTGTVRFDHLKRYAGEGKVVDVLLNAPDLVNHTPIVLTDIRVVAEREPMTWSNVWGRVFRFII